MRGSTAGSSQPHVLVVDDDPALREIMAEVLAGAGYRVSAADNRARALEPLRQRRADVIVPDLMMPILDGWAFTEAYREVTGADIPIVGVSANVTPAMVERLQQLGVRVCLAKPFDVAELLDCVGRLAGQQRAA